MTEYGVAVSWADNSKFDAVVFEQIISILDIELFWTVKSPAILNSECSVDALTSTWHTLGWLLQILCLTNEETWDGVKQWLRRWVREDELRRGCL